jgi:AcrR family transcriptional regulator
VRVAGLRERKKEQTRRRIAAAALDLFRDRGYDNVTVSEIAEAAEVAKATLFTYYPTKESLVLGGVGDDDLAGIVAARPPGQSPLAALRAHFTDLAANPVAPDDSDAPEGSDALMVRMRVILDSPALSASANGLRYRQRRELADVLAREHAPTEAALMAAQITASLLTVQETFFQRLATGTTMASAARALSADVDLAFDLLEHGLARD